MSALTFLIKEKCSLKKYKKVNWPRFGFNHSSPWSQSIKAFQCQANCAYLSTDAFCYILVFVECTTVYNNWLITHCSLSVLGMFESMPMVRFVLSVTASVHRPERKVWPAMVGMSLKAIRDYIHYFVFALIKTWQHWHQTTEKSLDFWQSQLHPHLIIAPDCI